MKFKTFVEATKIAEGIFDWLKGKPKPEEEEPFSVRDRELERRNKTDQDTTADVNAMSSRFGNGSLYQALMIYNKLNPNSHYPDDLLNKIASSPEANKVWNEKYKAMFMHSKSQPETLRMILNKAFQELNMPSPQSRQTEPEAYATEIPSFSDLVDYIQKLLDQNRNKSAQEIKELVFKHYPGLYSYGKWAGARVGKALKKATSSRLSLYQPEPEEEPESNPNILRFGRLNKADEV